MLKLSPSVIYFSHSRLDSRFSGCAKDIGTTLSEIVSGVTPLSAIPLITVLEVEGAEGGRYVSLNNRRLYLFKELLRLGRLPGGEIQVRIKKPTAKEAKKYSGTLALTAKLSKCGASGKGQPAATTTSKAGGGAAAVAVRQSHGAGEKEEEEEEEEDEIDGEVAAAGES